MAARALALAAARAHLTAGHDVVVPQLFGRPEFLVQLAELAHDVGASFHELMLMDTRENVLARFAARTPGPHHHGTSAADAAAFHDRLESLLTDRPWARVSRRRPVASTTPTERWSPLWTDPRVPARVAAITHRG
ncbi:hypothetical protein AB0F91_13100 [Amycolatopsis sp. NPDC023774]|uniref:hypothetical protein n=1 Tax=Amycolatopsis sp. NPDC023774 TaxID=3155015 RepID=UPI0033FF3FA6